MGKAKKGKRSGKDDDMESDVDIDEQSVVESAKIKSKAKDKKKKKGDDVDELVDELAELKVDKVKGKKGKKSRRGDDDSDDNDSVSVTKPQKGKGKKQDDDGGDDDDDDILASDSDIESKSKGKGKKNQVKKGFAALDMNSDAESDHEVLPKAKSKAKKKKGKKNDDFDDDDDNDAYNVDFTSKVDVKNKTNSKKNKKKDNVESDDDIPKPKGKTKKGKKMSVSDDEDDNINILSSKGAKAKAPKSGFALLDVEGDDNDDDDDDDDNEEPSKSDDESEHSHSKERPKGKPQQPEKNQEPQRKKGKKGKKRQDSDDEIERALAELEIEYTGKKVEAKTVQLSEEAIDQEDISMKNKKEKVNKSKVETTDEVVNEDGNEGDGDDGPTVKTAAQKKKEKKEREKQKKLAQKKMELGKKVDGADSTKESSVEKQITVVEKVEEAIDGEEDAEDGKKRQDSDDEIERALAELEIEYTGKKVEAKTVQPSEEAIDQEDIPMKNKKEKVNKSKVKRTDEVVNEDGNEGDGDDGPTVKTAAQKKKEKKEREKQKKLAQKKMEVGKKVDGAYSTKESSVEKQTTVVEKVEEAIDGEEDAEDGKKKKKKSAKEDTKDKGKGPGRKMLAAMQDALKKVKEDEERAKREEEERIREEELREKARLEQLQLEQERKEKKKLKEKQRKERLKAEGKLLTTKQKQDRARAQAMLEALKAQGLEIPDVGEKKPRQRPSLGTRIRPNKIKQQTSQEEKEEIKNQVQVEIVDQQQPPQEKVDEDERTKSIEVVPTPEVTEEVKDSWDADSTEDEHGDETSNVTTKTKGAINNNKNQLSKKAKDKVEVKKKVEVIESSASDSDSASGSESESDDESNDEENDGSEHEKMTDAEKKRERARLRIQNRRIEAEKKKSLDDLRAAVVCVLGHVDTGKTKILDKLRRTNVQDGEAGGITQQIGATNVPIEAIQDSTRHVKGFAEKIFKIPGLLIIDTPGHESFSNLRNRGSSLCDIAVLVVDIMHGLEPQTLESIGLLKTKKCPFVVALNKIDRLYDWQTMNRKDVQDIIKGQAPNTQREFEKRSKDVILQFAEQGLNAALFYENPDPRSYVSLVPTSAITGEGMGNLLALIVDACQGPLAKRLMFSEELQATVLEVKALPGLGTTIDCILINGTLREGETMIVAGTDGPIVTQIRSLLMPQPLKELRVKNAYIEYREIRAAQGVKIAAKDLDKAIAGLNLQVAQKPDEVDLIREEIAKELSKALGNIKLAERGVFVQASTLGALEALLDFLRSSKIPYAGIRIGPVVKKDVMKASIMLEHDSQYATILAFDVKIERDAQELADSLGVKIFQADIIYHLFDKFTAYREELKQRKREEHKHIAVFPCKLKILPQFIFNSRDPIVMGVMVEAGIVKEGTPVCVPSKDFLDLGVVTSIEYNHKTVESARKGQEVCIKIEPVPGEAPKMYGRHFDEKDMITSKISRQSIDACKDYFRDDLLKTDWQLMVELKKLFQIL